MLHIRSLLVPRSSVPMLSQPAAAFSILSKFRKEPPTKQPAKEEIPATPEPSAVPTVSSFSQLESKPLMTSRTLRPSITCSPSVNAPRQAWLETLKGIDDVKIGMVDLHPDIFAVFPRLDLVHTNLQWQAKYRVVDYRAIIDRYTLEAPSLKKPWPQKKSGRARAGTRRSPLFVGGGQCKGPRGPKSLYYMLPESVRLWGLVSMLSVKCAQDDLHIVDNLDLPPEADSQYLLDLAEHRGWGDTVLFVQKSDVAPQTIANACAPIKYFNLSPVYGLNVWGMVKHDTLVLTLDALEQLEERLLFHFTKCKQFRRDIPSKSGLWDEPVGQYFTGYEADVKEQWKFQ